MSQIASFYLIRNDQKEELSDGNCSGAVYMAIWDWCECELDMDVRFPAPQTEDSLDCARLEGELASNLLTALRGRIFRNWPPKLPQTGTSLSRRCKAGWKCCAPIWSWCRVTLPCCMRWCRKWFLEVNSYGAKRPAGALQPVCAPFTKLQLAH